MDENKKDEEKKESSGNKTSSDAMTCPECGGGMMRMGDRWVCKSCDHEMSV